MKVLPRLTALLLTAGVLHADESAPDPTVTTGIPGPIADGTPAAPAPKSEPLEFSVISTLDKRIEVQESSELTELPPVKGTITATVQLVEDPGLPDPPPPLPQLPVDDAAVQGRLEELRAKYQETRIAFVSATVYDHSRTLLTVYPSGEAAKSVTVWSNLDFNHFSGFSTFNVAGQDGTIRQWALLMGIGNTDTRRLSERFAQAGREYQEPKAPELPSLTFSGPSFVIAEGSEADPGGLELVQDMHALYQTEGHRMETAYVAREKAYKERKAYLIANPPVPKDVTIRFWKRNYPTGNQQTQTGADQ